MKRFFLLSALCLATATSCFACATISYRPGDTIQTTDESALIVWNAQTGVEDFVRRATFQTKARNFGFLVPTPSRPILAEADDSLFSDLEDQLQAKTETRKETLYFWNFWAWKNHLKNHFNKAADSLNTDGSGVQVVEQGRVGGYDTSVLKGSDARQLKRWLRLHHYAATPDFDSWAAFYIRRGWYVTAFKIAANQVEIAQAKAVRLSFKTTHPFYPYRETKRQSEQSLDADGMRSLRLYFVGDKRVEGRVENGTKSVLWSEAAFVGDARYSAPLSADTLRANGLDVPPGNLRLTTFDDWSSPRKGWGDLKFSPSKDQRQITPPPNIVHKDARVRLPLDVLALVGLGCISMLRRRK